MIEVIDKNKIKELADGLIGIPYKHKGRTKKGLDCFGLPLLFYKRLGFEIPDYEDYIKNWSIKGKDKILENYDDEYYKYWKEVKEPAFGDTLIFYSGRKQVINHMGILIDENKFLHTSRVGTIITLLSTGDWRDRIEGYYRLKQL